VLDAANFNEGQFVKKGDLLFRIDPRPFAAALAQARAMLVRDQAQLKNENRDMTLYEHLNQIGAVSTAFAAAHALHHAGSVYLLDRFGRRFDFGERRRAMASPAE